MLDMCTIRDTRTGHYAKVPKDAKMKDQVSMGASGDSLEDKTFTVAYGPDLVNISFHNFVTSKKDTAKVIFLFFYFAFNRHRNIKLLMKICL